MSEHGMVTARERLHALEQRVTEWPAADQALIGQVLKELAASVQELQATAGELLRQHQDLAAARDRLEEERRRYQDLFDFAPDGYLLTTPQGVIQDANRAAVRMFCARPDREPDRDLAHPLKGESLARFVDPEDLHAFQRLLLHLHDSRGLWGREMQMRAADGRAIPSVVDVTVVSEGGHQQGLRWLVRDVSERKREVAARTAELRAANVALQREIATREDFELSLRARARQQEAVAALGLRALSAVGIAALMDEAAQAVVRTLDVEYSKVLQRLPGGDRFLVRAAVGWADGLVGRATVGAGNDSQAGYTLLAREPVAVESLAEETRFKSTELQLRHGVVSGLSVVIHGRDSPYGVLCAHSARRRRFTEDDAYFLQAVANVLAAALERERGDAALRQIEWLLGERARPGATLSRAQPTPYGDLTAGNRLRELMDAVGDDLLAEIAGGYLDLLDTSVAVYERNGDYALNIATSGWCQLLDHASRRLCDTPDNRAAMRGGRWHCHESCWEASRLSMERGQPVDIECHGGIRIYAAPIMADGAIVGSINFGYGDPPRQEAKLCDIAGRYGLDPDELRARAAAYESRPPFIVETAKSRLLSSARMMGTIVERKLFEDQLLDTILDRKRAEAEQQKFVQLVENAGDFIGMANPEGRVLFVNPAGRRMVGFTRAEQVIGTCLADYWTPETWARVEQEGLRAVDASGRWLGEGVLRPFADGGLTDVEINLFLVKHPHTAEPLCLAMVQHDITERKKVERLKSEFIATVSHELRTPLTSIAGALGLMSGGVAAELPRQAKDLVDIAYRNSQRLIRLINDILDINKIDAGQLPLRFQHHRVMALLEQAVEANRAYAEQYRVEVVLSGDVGDAAVQVDADRFVQVLTNLVSNAAKFSPPGEPVGVAVSLNGDRVRVAVSDHGPGIPEEFQPRIFEKFSQADASDARRKGGTGLGLSISKAIVERLGGQIAFTTAPGMGTTFYFELPRHAG